MIGRSLEDFGDQSIVLPSSHLPVTAFWLMTNIKKMFGCRKILTFSSNLCGCHTDTVAFWGMWPQSKSGLPEGQIKGHLVLYLRRVTKNVSQSHKRKSKSDQRTVTPPKHEKTNNKKVTEGALCLQPTLMKERKGNLLEIWWQSYCQCLHARCQQCHRLPSQSSQQDFSLVNRLQRGGFWAETETHMQAGMTKPNTLIQVSNTQVLHTQLLIYGVVK